LEPTLCATPMERAVPGSPPTPPTRTTSRVSLKRSTTPSSTRTTDMNPTYCPTSRRPGTAKSRRLLRLRSTRPASTNLRQSSPSRIETPNGRIRQPRLHTAAPNHTRAHHVQGREVSARELQTAEHHAWCLTSAAWRDGADARRRAPVTPRLICTNSRLSGDPQNGQLGSLPPPERLGLGRLPRVVRLPGPNP
jgi:hypothetical protein